MTGSFIFGIYLWILLIYAFFRWTGLINRTVLQEHLLGKYLEMPIKIILSYIQNSLVVQEQLLQNQIRGAESDNRVVTKRRRL